jgi:hypothetical protein
MAQRLKALSNTPASGLPENCLLVPGRVARRAVPEAEDSLSLLRIQHKISALVTLLRLAFQDPWSQ